jgi:hypothetical protein
VTYGCLVSHEGNITDAMYQKTFLEFGLISVSIFTKLTFLCDLIFLGLWVIISAMSLMFVFKVLHN